MPGVPQLPPITVETVSIVTLVLIGGSIILAIGLMLAMGIGRER